jgi:transaldolase
VAIANARLAYARYLDRFSDEPSLADDRWHALRAAGARPQRPLWASTGTKDPADSDVMYVERLITPDAVNTMPEATLHAFADHGDVGHALPVAGSSNATLRRARTAGVDLDAITAELEREGVRSFRDSYRELLDCIRARLQSTRDRTAA